ncbi:GNAT family N-acetyltransferase [Alteromonas lipolytica]|uniref:N-acetyltransferase domain-containing protein n=1 Tax=Alteromonas lipolytica TaxID=1856405 RepID=A0A1E8FJX1_9ALTE|nr:GNAT family N-acetyltransferase [Alteromonas lipolytica]OFI35733.1 hypothetical protein BFC17_10625 [Alteromonas lipolytica]GGF80319.1 hypothetical protein GCM10011338_35730 [Alteromonas lipolytica]
MFSYRTASDADFAFLLALRLSTMDEHLKKAGLFLTPAQHEDRVRENFALSQVVSVNDEPVGLLKYDESSQAITVYQLQILPQFQGRGYGGGILRELMSRAGNKTVSLGVLKDNPAYHLYKRLGFIVVGEDQYEYHMAFNR